MTNYQLENKKILGSTLLSLLNDEEIRSKLLKEKILELAEREEEIEGLEADLQDKEAELEERELELDERESKIPLTDKETEYERLNRESDDRKWRRYEETTPVIDSNSVCIGSIDQKITFNLRADFDELYMFFEMQQPKYDIEFTYEFETAKIEYQHISEYLILLKQPFIISPGTCTLEVKVKNYIGKYYLISSKHPKQRINTLRLESGRKQVLSHNKLQNSYNCVLPKSAKYVKIYFKIEDNNIFDRGMNIRSFESCSFPNSLCVYIGCRFHCPALPLHEWLVKPFYLQDIADSQRFEVSNYNVGEYIQSIVLYQDPDYSSTSVIKKD